MGFLTPEQLGEETARVNARGPSVMVKSPYARSSNSLLSPGHGSSQSYINRSRAAENSGTEATKLLGIEWYWWAAVAGGLVLLIIFMSGF